MLTRELCRTDAGWEPPGSMRAPPQQGSRRATASGGGGRRANNAAGTAAAAAANEEATGHTSGTAAGTHGGQTFGSGSSAFRVRLRPLGASYVYVQVVSALPCCMPTLFMDATWVFAGSSLSRCWVHGMCQHFLH